MSVGIVLSIGEWMLRVRMTETLWHVIHVLKITSEKFNTFMFFYTERIIIIAVGLLRVGGC